MLTLLYVGFSPRLGVFIFIKTLKLFSDSTRFGDPGLRMAALKQIK